MERSSRKVTVCSIDKIRVQTWITRTQVRGCPAGERKVEHGEKKVLGREEREQQK